MALRAWMLKNIPDEKRARRPRSALSLDEQTRRYDLDPAWLDFLALTDHELKRLDAVYAAVSRERASQTVYPSERDVHRWARMCRPDAVRVVILGQDPYHDGSACGLAFGTVRGARPPPSLHAIYAELTRSVPGFVAPADGCLDRWCAEGVLLLNSTFTVERGKPGSHRHIGWQFLSDRIVRTISDNLNSCVFMLWGAHAQEKEYLIDASRHLILKCGHPSPRAMVSKTPFAGCRHFASANEYLAAHDRSEVDWRLRTPSSPFPADSTFAFPPAK